MTHGRSHKVRYIKTLSLDLLLLAFLVFTAELEKRLNMYQSLVHTPHNPGERESMAACSHLMFGHTIPEENEYSEPFSTKQPHSKP